MNKKLIAEGKYIISCHDIIELKEYYHDIKQLSNTDYQINYQYIFQQLFTHACLKKNKAIIIYLTRLYFEAFDDIAQIALRQSFFYAKYTIKNNKDLTKWYSNNIIPLIKSY